MEREELKRIIDSPENYDETKAETVYAWVRDWYSRSMRWVMICVYIEFSILLVPAVYSAIAFFRTDQVGSQVMHATIFLFCNLWMGFISVFAWVIGQRPNTSREFKRLELRIAELTETISNK